MNALARGSAGFGLIELMVAVAILSILVIMGVPTFSTWIINSRVRNAAESVQHGLRLARTEAVQRGVPARFELNAAGAAWTVCVPAFATPSSCSAPQYTVQSRLAQDGGSGVLVGATTNAATPADTDVSRSPMVGGGVTFGPLGRVLASTTPLRKIDAAYDRPGTRRLVTVVNAGGGTRVCDPALDRTVYPQGCAP